jgi:hypothetical protein
MSTKATIVYHHDDFHVYYEMMDEDYEDQVHIDLREGLLEASVTQRVGKRGSKASAHLVLAAKTWERLRDAILSKQWESFERVYPAHPHGPLAPKKASKVSKKTCKAPKGKKS